MALTDLGEQPGEPLHLGPQLRTHDLQLGRPDDLTEVGRFAGEAGIGGLDGLQIRGVDKEAVGAVEEVVAGGPGHRPRLGKILLRTQDLLYRHIDASRRIPQPGQIALGVGQPVDVVDAQPVDGALGDEIEDEAVGVSKHPVVLDPQSRQRLDVEKPTVGKLLGCRPPKRQAVVLPLQEGVEDVRITVDRLDLGVDRGRHIGPFPVQDGEAAEQGLLLAMTLFHRGWIRQQGVREVTEARRQLRQFV